MIMRKLLFVTAAALLVASPALAKGGKSKWMDGTAVGLPKGSQLMVVSGDPSKDGPFVVRIKAPADFMVPPHHHPGDEVVRVVSGGPLHYGMGDKVDMAHVGTLEKGYHVTMAAGMNHFAHVPTATVLQVNGNGPFGITYVNAADDPRTAK